MNGPGKTLLGVPGCQTDVRGCQVKLGQVDATASLGYYVDVLAPNFGIKPQVGDDITLSAGSAFVLVSDTAANDVILLSYSVISGTPGYLSMVIFPGVGFSITSTSALDNSTVNYLRCSRSH